VQGWRPRGNICRGGARGCGTHPGPSGCGRSIRTLRVCVLRLAGRNSNEGYTAAHCGPRFHRGGYITLCRDYIVVQWYSGNKPPGRPSRAGTMHVSPDPLPPVRKRPARYLVMPPPSP
jgi:hypothetical protein